MLIVGIVLMMLALAAMSVSLGLVGLPDKAVRSRLLASGDKPAAAKGQRMRQLDVPEESARYVASRGMLRRIEHNLVLAGHPAGWTIRNILLAKILIPVVVLLLVSRFAFFGAAPIVTVIGIASVIVAYFAPDLLVYSRGVERQEEMQRQLPDLLDKIVITIEAGMGFESALVRTAEFGTGPLADEFVRTVQDIRLGMSRRAAYQALQGRTSSEDIQSFIRGIMQAEEHGSSIAGMVRIQSREMRVRRKLRAEAKAGQVSVKLLGPLMTCIFPVLFIVVLAPGIINAVSTFG